MVAGMTERDKAYIQRCRQRYGTAFLEVLREDLPKMGFNVAGGTGSDAIDADGWSILHVSEKTCPNLIFLFSIHAECGELMELTGRKAGFYIESAATREKRIFYTDDPLSPNPADFMARIVREWGRPRSPKP